MSNKTDEAVKVVAPVRHRFHWLKASILFFLLLVLIGVGGYGYFQLTNVNVSLANTVSTLREQLSNTQKDMTGLQTAVVDLQRASEKAQALSAQQAQLIADWQATQKGHLEKWHIAEAQYLVKLAQDHLLFTYNATIAKTLLVQAAQILQGMDNPAVLAIRQSIAKDMTTLQAATQVDVTALYVQLMALNHQVDQLPLPMQPLKAAAPVVSPVSTADLPWWKAGWQQTWNMLRQIVIVHYNGSDALPLVMPEEKAFLYQNLHAQLESAMWGVLHRNVAVYQSSLARAILWTQRYFQQDDKVTQAVLEHLQELIKINVQPPTVHFANTLQLFDRALVS